MKKIKEIGTKKVFIIIIVVLVVIALAVGGTLIYNYISYRNTNEYQLEKLGYSKEQREIIKKNFSTSQIELVLKKGYNEKYIDITNDKYFLRKNFNRYLEYMNLHNDYSVSKIVTMVNVNNDEEAYSKIKDTDMEKGDLILVNKHYKMEAEHDFDTVVNIPLTYSYQDHKILPQALDAYMAMARTANNEGIKIVVNGSYRSYDTQSTIYNRQKSTLGVEEADKNTARPGHSEHETGLALDIIAFGVKANDFETTDAFTWLLNNAHKYGFILRYPADKEDITGYTYEPWHYRYVGIDAATKIKQLDITFDEYYAYYVEEK